MKRVIFLFLVSIISIIPAAAQETDSLQNKFTHAHIDSLSSRLNKLQHDYDFLRCQYELKIIQLELNRFINSLNISSNEILIDRYHRIFNIDLYTSFRNKYDAYTELFNSLKESVSQVKTLVALMCITSNFSNKEEEYLSHSSSTLDKSITAAESSLNYYKVVLDNYKNKLYR